MQKKMIPPRKIKKSKKTKTRGFLQCAKFAFSKKKSRGRKNTEISTRNITNKIKKKI